ncbi:hypothetical protein, partial [Staphylococcus pseudintermedius]|uniref:hypothetical protein n=1 Tax=Staphylococcus pseudintermedius TaxID=283734 RepID=UPI0036F1F5E8
RKIPAVRNSEGEVIMPYRMADGSVVTTKELYHSACGKVSKSADGVVRIEKAVRTFPDFKQFSGENDNSGVFSAEGGMFTLA